MVEIIDDHKNQRRKTMRAGVNGNYHNCFDPLPDGVRYLGDGHWDLPDGASIRYLGGDDWLLSMPNRDELMVWSDESDE